MSEIDDIYLQLNLPIRPSVLSIPTILLLGVRWFNNTLDMAHLIYRCFTIDLLKTLNKKKPFYLQNPIMRIFLDFRTVELGVDQNEMYDGSRFHVDRTFSTFRVQRLVLCLRITPRLILP